MQVYQTDREGFYVGASYADPDPKTPDNWLIPAGCVTIEPPALVDGQRARWVGDEWAVIDPEPQPEPEPEPTPEELSAEVRAQRNALLTASDWTQVADAPVDQAAWVVYRQALRDIPQQEGFPENVVWPVEPA